MGIPINTLRDDFEDSSVATAWSAVATGSATVAETGGQARFTLPSSVAGSHVARYTSVLQYDLTGGVFSVNIQQMVSVSVAATAFIQLYLGSNNLQWLQLSGTLTAVKVVAGVATTLFTVTWSGSTYKYLRIRESAGTVYFDSSSNGTSWTNRANLPTPFDITGLFVDYGATCANVPSPGSLRLDDVNLILPALTTTWRKQQAVWQLLTRFEQISLAVDVAGTAQGFIITADGVDVSNNPTGSVRYWSGPANGGRELTEQLTLAAAQAMAVDLPLDGRFELPVQVEARVFQLNSRSIDGASFILREFFPRSLIRATDIEAEVIKGLTLIGHQFIADSLSAMTIYTGDLLITGTITIDPAGALYQGSGTAAVPVTGLKIFNVGGIGKLSTYNAGVEQVTFDTDGALKFAAGNGQLDASGVQITVSSLTVSDISSYKFINAGVIVGGLYMFHVTGTPSMFLNVAAPAGKAANLEIRSLSAATFQSTITLRSRSTASNEITIALNANSTGPVYAGNFSSSDATVTSWNFDGAMTGTKGIQLGNVAVGWSNNFLTILNNGVAALGITNFGFVFVHAGGQGQACYAINGSLHTTAEVFDIGATFTPTATTAASINIYWSAANSRYEIENKRGATINTRVWILEGN